jgi:uncharacterized protein
LELAIYKPSSRGFVRAFGTLFALCFLVSRVCDVHAFAAADAVIAHHPSFSCVSPSALEAVICGDPSLADRDRDMAILYAAARAGALGTGVSQEERAQRSWLKSRNEECAKGDAHRCLTIEYNARLNELAVAALFQAPEAALAELNRQYPTSVPIYEAIYRYGTLNQPERAETVTSLIAPIFDAIHTKPWASPLKGIPDAQAAATTDDAFAAFLDVASVSSYTLTLPCAAIVRRPGLVYALDALYGGAIDGQLINSDCESTLPATPKLDSLLAKVVSAQSFCPGTIRFSQGREYQKELVEIRLHRLGEWAGAAPSVSTNAFEERFRSEHEAQMEGAIDELGKHYSVHFSVSEKVAHDDAVKAINSVISGAFDLCPRG